jgi:hypothetical protein
MKTVLAVLLLLATDNWVGVWIMDPARSTYSPGPTPKSVTLKYEFVEGGVKVTNDTIAADGTQVVRSTTVRFDGADYPYSNNINADTASGKRINDYSFETQWKKNGKPTLSQRISVDRDAKTLTVIQTGTDYQGKTVRNVSVYSKQR